VIEDPETGVRATTPVKGVEALAPDDAYDLVVVLMRKNQVAAILPALAANKATPNVLFMVNNAAGPDAYAAALGRERVLLGFPGAGGRREGHVVYARLMAGGIQATTLGELDGAITPRLTEIAGVFEQANLPVELSAHMDAWLKTHAVVVTPIANAIYAAGGDITRTARTRDALLLMVRAMKEGFVALRALGIPITPFKLRILIEWLPEPFQMLVLRQAYQEEAARLMLESHANAARDEMALLTDEVKALIKQAGTPSPDFDRLALYVDPAMPPLAEGSAARPMSWRGVWIALGIGLVTLNFLANWLPQGRNRKSAA
jgi:2-dehydropantoate 2-reductase